MLHGPAYVSRGRLGKFRQLLVAVALLSASEVSATEQSSREPRKWTEPFGAVVAPALLPDGATAAYAYVGAQELGAGFRQGFQHVELEARARFNYFLLSSAIEGLAKYSIFHGERGELAPYLGLGFVYNSGSTYYDEQNFSYIGIRALAGMVASYDLGGSVALLARAEAPIDFTFNASGGLRFKPLGGLGMEFRLSSDTTLLTLGELGWNLRKGPTGEVSTSLGYQFELGVGFRF